MEMPLTALGFAGPPGAASRLAACGIAILLLGACATRGDTGTSETPAGVPEAVEPPAAAEDVIDAQTAVGIAIEAAVAEAEAALDEPLPPEKPVEESQPDPCATDSDGQQSWLDKTQQGISWTVCGTARWFDGFFGDRARFDATNSGSSGRLGAFSFYDQLSGADPDFWFRVKLALPTLKNRTKLLFGRDDERRVIEERGTNDSDALPDRFSQVTDTSWLLGLGYQKGGSLKRGFDSSVGVKLKWPLDPYLKLRYFENWNITDESILRFRQTGFWTERRGFGTTTNLDLDVLASRNFMVRWANSGTIAEDRRGLEWSSSLGLYQSLSNRRAINYRSFVFGETNAPVPISNYGIESRFRQRILRKWLFLEFLVNATWPKYVPGIEREVNFGAGIGFEMYFGPLSENQML